MLSFLNYRVRPQSGAAFQGSSAHSSDGTGHWRKAQIRQTKIYGTVCVLCGQPQLCEHHKHIKTRN